MKILKKVKLHKISTKLMLTYSCIILFIFGSACIMSIYTLNQRFKKELIRTDQEVLSQISHSIILMTDLMAEKNINVYSNSHVQNFFTIFSDMDQNEFTQKKVESYEMAQEIKKVRNVLVENALLYTQMNGAVTLITKGGVIFTSWSSESFGDYKSGIAEEKERWDEYFEKNLSNFHWVIMNGRDAMSFHKNDEKHMLMLVYNYRSAYTKIHKGYVCIAIDAKELNQCYGTWMDADVNNELYLVDLKYSNSLCMGEGKDSELSKAEMQEIQNILAEKGTECIIEKGDYLYNCKLITKRDWVLVNKIPVAYVKKDNIRSVYIFGTIFLIGCVVACILVVLFTLRFSSRVEYLRTLMVNAGAEKYRLKYEENHYDELDQIGESFNQMEQEIENNIQKLLEEERARKINEINYLHAQINTHFLYNIFNSIKMLSVLGRNKDINEVITSLVRLLKGTLDVSSELIPVAEELKNVEHYFRIENIIHLDELKLEISCEDVLRKKRIPKLLIQPVVENCIIHGFAEENAKEEKKILIQIEEEKEKERLYIVVVDNGRGMNKERLNSVRSRKNRHASNVGLRNIEERIRVLYGEQYGVEIQSNLQKGTRVTLSLPIDTEQIIAEERKLS